MKSIKDKSKQIKTPIKITALGARKPRRDSLAEINDPDNPRVKPPKDDYIPELERDDDSDF
ncbi:hypothetical protein A3H26_02645 [candidate division WWE3 bacterium RIFCSPLOWO2_12_FULL_36_10]|uniref:Uncharacterized protein n=1 Tax=candidate division WWE3 bacterium RIFCSPLOWO2_12_FULL_36_10 TaxID=1802630 RepID=A0A1F4VIZ5_UNCKA|nr:MAG: hypothetical protein A3H26_02645 [candidate division WWE3 bacterium RIFCSPLOWO2_12_FULL_36_10]